MTLTTVGVDTLIDCLKVLQLIADERTSYAENFREEKDFSALAAKLLMKDMELRQSYVKESVMNEAATLRQEWQKQLAMKRKMDVVHKVNDDIITNVGGDVLRTMG